MKVGKAIYNILSQSTDVQSNFPFNTTDYSPTGTELVTNGDFSDAGINLVDNPNFTDGVEQLTQPIDLTIDFDANGGGVIVDADTFTTAGGSLDGLLSKVSSWNLVSGKSYKLVIAGSTTSSGFTIGDGGGSGNEYGSGFGTHYFVSLGTRLWIRQNTSGTTDLTTFTIEELGEDWTAYTSGTSTVTYDGSIAELNIDALNSNVGIYQDNIFALGKSYKIVLSMKATAAFDVEIVESNSAATINAIGTVSLTTSYQDFTFYYVGTGTYDLFIHRLYSGSGASQTISIQTVSVKELGADWSVNPVSPSTLSFNADGAFFNVVGGSFVQINQSLSFTAAKSYKLILTYTGDGQNKTFRLLDDGSSLGGISENISTSSLTPITQTFYFTANTASDTVLFKRNSSGDYNFTINSVSVQEMILTKIFPELAPPDIDAPYIVYSVVSNSPSDTKNANGDIDTANIEVYGFQDTYNKAVDLGVSVRAALDRKTGTYNTIEIQSTNYVNEQMDVNEARKLWAAIQDYSIRIKNI